MINMERFAEEIKRLSPLLSEAERTGKLIVHCSAGSEYNPYPIVFKPEQLVDHIKNGSWLYVGWKLEDQAVVKKAILQRILELQERLTEL